MGHSVYIYDLSGRVIYWNRHSEVLLGYSAAEALGKNILKLIVAPRDVAVACNIIHRVSVGESWTGLFPIKHKSGEMNSAVATVTPFYDDHAERQPEADSSVFSRSKNTISVKLGINPQQPLQTAIASKISNLVLVSVILSSKVSNKVKSRIRTGENCVDGSDHKDATSSGACTPRGVIQSGALGVFYPLNSESTVEISRYCGDESEGKPTSQKFMNLMAKKGISWPWEGNDREESEAKTARLVWPWAGDDQENETFMLKSPYLCLKYENHIDECNRPVNEAPGSSSSSANANSTSSSSNSGSTGSSPVNRIDLDTDCIDYEILWEELTTREQIGKGCCYQDIPKPGVFRGCHKQEVSLMKRLRHPNVLLFMGAVTSPQRLCIVTEFLSLATEECCKIRVETACSYGFGYCLPLVMCTVTSLLRGFEQVGDFGLSRLKHATYLSSRSGKGTPQWMAPEVLRNEPSNEKSDVYSFGVVLWELATGKIPWDGLNPMQVIAAVGFMNQRLDIPKELDPRWASIIASCWLRSDAWNCNFLKTSDPQSRPTFRELLNKLRDLQRQCTIQFQQARNSAGDGSRKGS
ncbi:hypothetical protein V6N12_061756 [Hibiscus sabdariffa]|uniref:PAS domain-containing protein tyrosine kinase family protein n=1 Tax=Hibiscus sabdariffa TaxID=183260 RepID=A0ABR2DY02_9ROSI